MVDQKRAGASLQSSASVRLGGRDPRVRRGKQGLTTSEDVQASLEFVDGRLGVMIDPVGGLELDARGLRLNLAEPLELVNGVLELDLPLKLRVPISASDITAPITVTNDALEYTQLPQRADLDDGASIVDVMATVNGILQDQRSAGHREPGSDTVFTASGPTWLTWPQRTVTATYTVADDDVVMLLDASGGSFTLTLPLAADYPGRVLFFSWTSASGTATVARAGSDTIDGSVSSFAGGAITVSLILVSDGVSDWTSLSRA